MTGLARQLDYKHALRSAVAFAKWMHPVELNHECGSAVGKFLAAQTTQVIFIAQSSGDPFEIAGNKRPFHERLPANFSQNWFGSNCAI